MRHNRSHTKSGPGRYHGQGAMTVNEGVRSAGAVMKADLKQKWAEALRSGKYRQGRGVLCNADGAMCCLGVLLDIEYPAGWSDSPARIPGEVAHYHHEHGNYFGDFLDAHYRKSRGLTSELGEGESIGHRLAALNDSGKSFAEIADWIDQNIPADESVQS